jgi:hypothetical protein
MGIQQWIPNQQTGENIMWVQAIVDPKLYAKITGSIITIWGHRFEVQQDGSLCLDMNTDFIASEMKAGRIKRMASPPPGKDKKIFEKIVIKQDPPVGFTMNIGNYYGAGDLNTLIERVEKMKNKEIVVFASERFPTKKKLRINMKSEDMIDKVRSYIDSALVALKKDV